MAGIFNIKENLPGALSEAAGMLKKGEIFIYPTDTLYGFGCAASNHKAVEKIYTIKKRSITQPFSIFFPSLQYFYDEISISSKVRKIAESFLPGALTLVIPYQGKSKWSPRLFSEGNFIGVRVPNHPFCMGLGDYWKDAIITSSVNFSGEAEMRSIEEIQGVFGSSVAGYFRDPDLEKYPSGQGSTVIRIDENDKVSCLREGAIPFSQIGELAYVS